MVRFLGASFAMGRYRSSLSFQQKSLKSLRTIVSTVQTPAGEPGSGAANNEQGKRSNRVRVSSELRELRGIVWQVIQPLLATIQQADAH